MGERRTSMKYITEVSEHGDAIRSPQCIIIYSSVRTCPPCRQLKQFMEKEYPDLDHVYYVDIDLRSLKPLLASISALPTLEFYQNGDKIKEIEGFDKHLIEDMIQIVYRDTSETNTKSSTTHTPSNTQASSPVLQSQHPAHPNAPPHAPPHAPPNAPPMQHQVHPGQPQLHPGQPQLHPGQPRTQQAQLQPQQAQLQPQSQNVIKKIPYATQVHTPPPSKRPDTPPPPRDELMEFPPPKKTKVDQIILDIQKRWKQ